MKTITTERFYRQDGGQGNPQIVVRLWRDEHTTGLHARVVKEQWFDWSEANTASKYAKDLARVYGAVEGN